MRILRKTVEDHGHCAGHNVGKKRRVVGVVGANGYLRIEAGVVGWCVSRIR